MFSNRNYKILTYIFGCIHIFLVLIVLSQGAVPIVTDWIAAISIITPCGLNIVFTLFWMIGTGLRRPSMISLFKYFTYAQMALIAVLAIGFIVQCFLNGGQFHLYIMIFIVLSLFVLSMIELFVTIGGHRAVMEELLGSRMRAVEMTEWTS
ncbi:uncharacterized protein LOC109420233 isoform X2 [Aedes albopictus]|uniref:Secreted protein n=1 Tax=Aedes albopictus TaxID=7160 RepID=A0ABM1ZWN8_AEDAL|nr:uncharacterized protein LOC109420233 isoform X2 [Aedes albopictus]XP_029725799.1 uncharacterized protein LOC109420233 isoform X2 [Aedes albopictus]